MPDNQVVPSVARFREPETPTELARVICIFLADAFGWRVDGRAYWSGDGGELELSLPDGREVTVLVATPTLAESLSL